MMYIVQQQLDILAAIIRIIGLTRAIFPCFQRIKEDHQNLDSLMSQSIWCQKPWQGYLGTKTFMWICKEI